MNTYTFAPDVTDNQRDRIVIQLRRDGYSAYREGFDRLNSNPMQLIATRMVRAYKINSPLAQCYHCGLSPIMHRVEWPSGRVSFNFGCPDMECRANDKSPAHDAWKPSREEAASWWNSHNATQL